MQVEKLMTREPVMCRKGDSLSHAAQLMWEADCGCLPVVEDGDSKRVIGTITDRDICMSAHFANKTLNDMKVEEAMPREMELRTVRAKDSIADAQQVMQEGRVRRLPVVEEGETLLGMLSIADLARECARGTTGRSKKAVSDADVSRTLAAICQPNGQVAVTMVAKGNGQKA